MSGWPSRASTCSSRTRPPRWWDEGLTQARGAEGAAWARPVQARGASESATSEQGAKNAEIEANGNETQAEAGPEDNIHGHDSDGENEANCEMRIL